MRTDPNRTHETNKPLVFLVEDDPGTREVFGIVLEVEGFAVQAFDTAEEALADVHAKPSALVTDLTLSGEMDGIALARALKERPEAAELPLFAITGWHPQQLPAEDAALFRQVFLKPIDVSLVSAAIRASIRAA